jgi:hypothetical protein
MSTQPTVYPSFGSASGVDKALVPCTCPQMTCISMAAPTQLDPAIEGLQKAEPNLSIIQVGTKGAGVCFCMLARIVQGCGSLPPLRAPGLSGVYVNLYKELHRYLKVVALGFDSLVAFWGDVTHTTASASLLDGALSCLCLCLPHV